MVKDREEKGTLGKKGNGRDTKSRVAVDRKGLWRTGVNRN
jgi:hypothetical protein